MQLGKLFQILGHMPGSATTTLKRPKVTSPIPLHALKFHRRSVRAHIQDQKAPVLFYIAAPAPTYCSDLISLISGTWEFLLIFPSLEFNYAFTILLVLCYILMYSQYVCMWG